MKVTEEVVAEIAELAQLRIPPEDAAEVSERLNRVLQLVEEMQGLDTEGVAPLSHPLEVTQRLRDDEVTEEDQRDLYQENAPLVEDGLFLVPRVVE